MYRSLFPGTLCLAAAVAWSSAHAVEPLTDPKLADIDKQLRAAVDLRGPEFGACLNESICQIGALTITAERRKDLTTWVPATIYWDPIDGLGVMGGNQNDEIDFDERLVITFLTEQSVSGIWLSDIFLGEATRYTGAPEDPEDAEYADIAFSGSTESSIRVSGVFELPDDPFNSSVNSSFREDGDLLNRFVINEKDVSIFAPDSSSGVGKLDNVRTFLSEEAARLFESDKAESLIASVATAPIRKFEAGQLNAQEIQSIQREDARLAVIRAQAEELRLVGDVSNGELGWYPQDTVMAHTIVFNAGYGTSSDYSVAGLMVE